MVEWSGYFNEGVSYYNATIGGIKKGRKLGNAVYYNLVGLALESFLTAASAKGGELPEHSTVSSMLRGLKKKHEVPESFTDEARFFNRFMNMCSLEIMEIKEPSDEDIDRLAKFVGDVKEWTESILGETCSVD
ncbi:hypothetical protein [Mangrovibacterium lignilyticum]|uniref:hypothetical protein n=1 Tax=Mangrovibacterium lignilyticum TaxID=2668052 RepID=UPI0013D5536E|nr:hypothetical protein [Mangrovibacterium lignilyticum]